MLMRPDCIANVRDAFLAGRGVVTSFTDETWPYYLDAAVIMLDGLGYAEYGFLKREDYGEQEQGGIGSGGGARPRMILMPLQ